MAQIPPPPPPPPGNRGPVHHGGPGGGPGPQHQQGPPPGFPPMQLPIRQQSSRISDLTPLRTMDEGVCRKKLTTYAVYTLRKAAPNDPRDKPTWQRTEIQEEKWAHEDIVKQITSLNKEKGKSVADKKAELAPNQSSQVTTLQDELLAQERDRNFEWTLAQIDRKEHRKNGVKQTATMTVYFKRSPLKDLNAVMLLQNIERARFERMMQQQQQRPNPQHQQQGQGGQQRPPPPPNHGGGPPPPPPPPGRGPPPNGQAPGQQFFKLERKQSKGKPRKDHRGPKKYHSETSSTDPYDSEYSDDSFSSGSFDTSISSQSRSDRRYHRKNKNRVRSYSRRREHHKDYHIDHRVRSPERQHHLYTVPGVPRQIAVPPGLDPVSAAYQAGKIDADAERHGLESLEIERRLLEEDRERLRLDRLTLSQPPRPLIVENRTPVIVERQVPLDRPLPLHAGEPRAIVSYGRDEPRRPEFVRHYTMDSRPRDLYMRDDLRSPRSPRAEEDYLRREREAEDYMDRRSRPNSFMERRRSEFIDRRPSERIVYGNDHPFAPLRRYPPSTSSWN